VGAFLTPVPHPAIEQVRSAHSYTNATSRLSEEDEQIKENNDVKIRVC